MRQGTQENQEARGSRTLGAIHRAEDPFGRRRGGGPVHAAQCRAHDASQRVRQVVPRLVNAVERWSAGAGTPPTASALPPVRAAGEEGGGEVRAGWRRDHGIAPAVVAPAALRQGQPQTAHPTRLHDAPERQRDRALVQSPWWAGV